jgi:hypothetical protein
LSPGSKPQAKAGDLFIPEQLISLAVGERHAANRFLGELHQAPLDDLGRSWEDSSCHRVAARGRDDCWYLP